MTTLRIVCHACRRTFCMVGPIKSGIYCPCCPTCGVRNKVGVGAASAVWTVEACD